MKVLQISNGIYPLRQAGTEIYTAELARALVDTGIETSVAVPGNDAIAQMLVDGKLPQYVRPIALAPQHRLGNKIRYAMLRGPLWRQRINELMREINPDVIHVHHAEGFGLSLLDVLSQASRPLLITLPDYWLLCPGILGLCQGSLARCARECCGDLRIRKVLGMGMVAYLAARRRRVRRFVQRARPVLAAISDATRERFQRQGFPADLLVTHQWGIDVDALRGNLGSQQRATSEPRIAYIGTMRPHKGCHVLLESFKRLAPGASLHFHGGGDEKYIQRLREDSHGANVHFHGRFDHAAIGAILADVDLVVIPSLWEETYCLVAQEAMAAKKPVVATRVGGLADRIIHGVNGFLVPPNDPAGLAAELTALLARLPQIAASLDYDRCQLTIHQDAEGWIALYEKTIADWAARN